MKALTLCAAGLLGLALIWPVPAAAPPGVARGAEQERPLAKEIQDVVYLGDSQPLLLRLRVRIDGKPIQEAWDGFLDRLFHYLDSNGDGFLDEAEAARTPPLSVLFAGGGFFGGGEQLTLSALDANRDGKVTRAELAEFYRKRGATPFQVARSNEAGDSNRKIVRLWSVGGQGPSADALNKRIFELLDTDRDGKLSRKEMEAAPKLLARLDGNDDEVLTGRELLGQPLEEGPSDFLIVSDLSGSLVVSDSLFHVLAPGRADPQLARKLLERYGKGRKKLTREQLGMDAATFEALDADGDGELDGEELARFGARAADLELAVRLGKRGTKPLVEVLGPARKGGPLAGRVRKNGEGELLLELGNTQIELGAPTDGLVNYSIDIKSQYSAQFKVADKDNNGYLDEREAQASPFFRGSFKAMDRDGDGKLFEKEVLAYVDQVGELQTAAAASCASLRVTDRGRGLFDLVDRDGDGRLGLRELRNMVKLIEELDRDGDGKLSLEEVPRRYRADFRTGPAGNFGGGVRAVAFAPGMRSSAAPAPRKEGPLWFRKMDRNRDGDVSRKEFLGTEEEFKRIDKDGDGLISLEEALAADRALRERGRKKE